MKKIDITLFLILNIFTLIIFTPWLVGHYATDTYNIMNIGYERYSIQNSLVDGRVFMFLIMQLASIFNVKYPIMISLLLVLALVISNIVVLIIKNVIIEKMESKKLASQIISYMIAYSLIYNFMYIENLYFMECFVMSISILINLIAAKFYVEAKKYYYIKTSVLLLISVFCYQGTISSFLAFVVLFLLLKKDHINITLKKLLKAIIILGITCAINLVFVKIISSYLGIQQTRLNINVRNNFFYILSTKLSILYYTLNNFYDGVFLLFLFIIVLIIIKYFKPNEKELYKLVTLTILSIFCSDIPYLVSLTAFNAGRTRFAIGSLVAILMVYIVNKLRFINKKEEKSIKCIFYCIVIVYFSFNVINYLDIIINSKITNECEKVYVQEIDRYITEYEKNNNIKIQKIQLVYDKTAPNAFYDVCTRKNVMTWNACSCRWSAVGVINFYTHRKLIPISENYIQMELNGMYEIIGDVLYIKIRIA